MIDWYKKFRVWKWEQGKAIERLRGRDNLSVNDKFVSDVTEAEMEKISFKDWWSVESRNRCIKAVGYKILAVVLVVAAVTSSNLISKLCFATLMVTSYLSAYLNE